MLLVNILYALCLLFEERWTSIDGGKSSGTLSNFLFDVELFTALGWGKCGHLVKCCHFQGWCFHELSEWAHPVLHWGVRTEGDESRSL